MVPSTDCQFQCQDWLLSCEQIASSHNFSRVGVTGSSPISIAIVTNFMNNSGFFGSNDNIVAVACVPVLLQVWCPELFSSSPIDVIVGKEGKDTEVRTSKEFTLDSTTSGTNASIIVLIGTDIPGETQIVS